MTIGLMFWILMLIWLIFGLYWNWPADNSPRGFGPVGGTLLLFVLLLLLGWGRGVKNMQGGFEIDGPIFLCGLVLLIGVACLAWCRWTGPASKV